MRLGSMIEKNISVKGFNLGGNLRQVPRALRGHFKFVIDGIQRLLTEGFFGRR